jgi:hypothetical protein
VTALADSLFKPNKAIHANGDRHEFTPMHVSWEREWWDEDTMRPKRDVMHLWQTDGHVSRVPSQERFHGPKMIGLLLEPHDLHPENYRAVYRALAEDTMDMVFTHQPHELIGPEVDESKIRLYPLGGTMIHESDWRVTPKVPRVSAIASNKRGLDGHALRHEVVAQLHGTKGFDAWGPEYVPIPLNAAGFYSKVAALQDYAFSIAIECVDTGYILSEHVLDCFLTGTVPIYWGPPDALKHWGFDERGVLRGKRSGALAFLANDALTQGLNLYESMLPSIRHNFIRAHEYTCPEDWLYRQHPELFA